MSTRMKIEKWLLADWSTTCSNNSGNKISDDMKNLALSTDGKETEINEYDRFKTEQHRTSRTSIVNDNNVESEQNEHQDFSPSASSWEPTDESSSSSDEDKSNKSNSIERFNKNHEIKRRRSKKALTPIHRPNAVVNVLKERFLNGNQTDNNRKRKYKAINETVKKSLPDSTKKTVPINFNASDNFKNILEIKETFQTLFKMIDDLKPIGDRKLRVFSDDMKPNTSYRRVETPLKKVEQEEMQYASDRSQSEESNRSDDNVLITNKYSKAHVPSESANIQLETKDEWVPIGSGKTLIHKDKFQKVNWKSYTMATRTLLLATFPRRILATHSLTGKRSPAFQNKPAKMCLDPKIVSDVVIEITSRFNVQENLVRNIITTKCADESKMYKMRLKSKNNYKSTRTSSAERENDPKILNNCSENAN
ncbi:unnamed protein product [Leptidea sinapis]|uniref:BEN domain-containing protein n=1 Tax=Leptidea sinapis TaxID=189913 RepID=A0A5E4PVH4_9NEOP|nr:unnamed protein product [Leptidea sinapis]